jgi:hypothetical protein
VGVKFEPVAVSVKAAALALAVLGLMLLRIGAGGSGVTSRLTTLKAQRPPTQAAGLAIWTGIFPWVATSTAWTAMVSCVAEPDVTVRA